MNRTKIAGVALITAGGGFLIAEAIAASAWESPAYSYATNYISDLEVQGPVVADSRTVHSPLWLLGSGAFLIGGLLLIFALLLIVARRGQGRLPLSIAIAGIACGAGLAFDGLVHEVPASSLPYHFGAALFIIIGGNVALVLLAVYAAKKGLSRAFVLVAVILAAFGFLGLFLLNVAPPTVVGIVERSAFYPVLFGELIIGVLILAVPEALHRRGHRIGEQSELQTNH
jgi:hypothetical membrane protein